MFNIKITNTLPKITNTDERRGYLARYFAAKANHIHDEVFEITHRHYEYYYPKRYVVLGQLNWAISGLLGDREIWVYTGSPIYDMGGREPISIPGVLTQNEGAVRFLSKKIPAVNDYLTDYKQFYIET